MNIGCVAHVPPALTRVAAVIPFDKRQTWKRQTDISTMNSIMRREGGLWATAAQYNWRSKNITLRRRSGQTLSPVRIQGRKREATETHKQQQAEGR